MATAAIGLVYVCTTAGCPERLRGTCDQPTFCSICLEDLTGVYLGPDVAADDILRGGERG